MNRFLFTSFLLFIALNTSFGQQIKINRDVVIDTLRLYLNISEEIDFEMQDRIRDSINLSINDFNESNHSYFILIDSTKIGTWIFIDMGNIHYVNTRESIIWTGMNLLFIAGHVYMISSYGWTIPIILIPATHSRITMDSNDGLISSPKKPKLAVGPSGMFRSINKQNDRYLRRFKKKTDRLLLRIDKQNVKNKVL